jgi:hypothetical protein
MKNNQLLFHCFLSSLGKFSKSGNAAELAPHYGECGSGILESIGRIEILLTPERIKIARHLGSEQADKPPIEVSQTRASFTLSNLSDLQASNPFIPENYSHLDIFGYFSIGLDPIASRTST